MSEAVAEKPPLGLRPRWIVASWRAGEILDAITRYNDVQKEVPQEWRDELEELNVWLEKEGYCRYVAREPQ